MTEMQIKNLIGTETSETCPCCEGPLFLNENILYCPAGGKCPDNRMNDGAEVISGDLAGARKILEYRFHGNTFQPQSPNWENSELAFLCRD